MRWRDVREKTVMNWEERALATSSMSIYGVTKAAQTACLLLDALQARVEQGEPLEAAELALLAGALKDTSDPLLRMFGK